MFSAESSLIVETGCAYKNLNDSKKNVFRLSLLIIGGKEFLCHNKIRLEKQSGSAAIHEFPFSFYIFI